ncbi:SGNH/GDSL hydrolase family protein, partial [Burkholderia cenocepacia]|nr:SGNH/GDSL hydrolase family protein [Burkholderia cenocepacia]
MLIESYGDSTTQGWQVVNGTGQVTPNSAPVVLQKLLQDRFGTTVTVSNNGVGSTEASQLLNGTDGVHPT